MSRRMGQSTDQPARSPETHHPRSAGPFPHGGDISLADILPLLWRRRGVVFLTLVICATLSVLLISRWQPTYRAVAEIAFHRSAAPPVAPASGSEAAADMQPMPAMDIETPMATLIGTDVLGASVALLRGEGIDVLSEAPEGKGSGWLSDIRQWLGSGLDAGQYQSDDQAENRAIAVLRSKINVERAGNAAVIRISLRDSDPVRAKQMLDGVTDTFVWKRQHDQRQRLSAQLQSVTQQRIDAEAAVTRAEADLEQERAQQQDIAGLDRDLVRQRLTTLNPQYQAATLARDEAAQRMKRLGAARTSGQPENLLEIPLVARDETVRMLVLRHAQLQAEQADLAKRYGSRHPKMIAKNAEVTAARTALVDAARRVAATIPEDLETARTKQQVLGQSIAHWQSVLARLDQAAKAEESFQRKVDTARQGLVLLTDRQRVLQSALAALTTDTEVVRRADQPTRPVFPARRDLALAAVLISVFLAVVMAFLREYFDQSIRSRSALEYLSGVPVFGEIPTGSDKGPGKILSDTEEADAVAHLRTVLNIAGATADRSDEVAGGAMVVCVTSPLPGDGKTRLAWQLAESFSSGGKRVLLLDGDLRRPTLPGFLVRDATRPKGDLVRLLLGECQADQAILPAGTMSETAHFDFVGAAAPVPSALGGQLISERAEGVISSLVARYDVVVIDAPPVLVVSDAIWLMRYADHRLLLIRTARSRRDDILSALDRLEQGGCHADGLVMVGGPRRVSYEYRDNAVPTPDPAGAA